MNTWKNNNVLTRFKESYFLEDADNRKSGLPTDAKPVGGTIFYIDETADGTYEFFDINGNLIENIQAGDRPYAYRVVARGSKDKYYIYHDSLYEGGVWTYCKDSIDVYESLGTSTKVGSGKTNTEIVMAKDSGAYVTADSNGIPTIWYQLQQARLAKAGGCDDWFVPSKDELEELRIVIESGSIKGGTVAGSSYNTSAFNKRRLWSSGEYSPHSAWLWYGYNQFWSASHKTYNNSSVLFTRAF